MVAGALLFILIVVLAVRLGLALAAAVGEEWPRERNLEWDAAEEAARRDRERE